MEKYRQRFVSKLDLTITPLVELSLISASVYLCRLIFRLLGPFRWLEFIIISYVILMVLTLIVLKLLRVILPPKEGVFTTANNPTEIYIWNLYSFLCIMNLSLFYLNTLMPIPFRTLFFRLLGGRIKAGVFAISGQITDPHMVTIDENAILGDECYISPHAIMALSSGDAMIVKRIHLKKNCIIGARAILLPGVIVGEGATVAVNTVVPMNTVIPDGGQWPSKG